MNIAKYIDFAVTVHSANDEVRYWIEHNLANYLESHKEEQGEIEGVIDFLCSSSAPKRLKKMSYDEALRRSTAWHKAQAKKGAKIGETEEDTEVVLDFGDGFRVVRLVGEAAYKREGFLMGHCVASYYGKDDEVFSLRDSFNMPHCTMSKDSSQIKGKGNGSVHPKYITYIVDFLEKMGMEVRDSEMRNLGYKNIKAVAPYVENVLFRGKYLYKGEEIVSKKGFFVTDNWDALLSYRGSDKLVFLGRLDLRGYTHPLPEGLTSVGGCLYLEGYTHPLPEGLTSVGESLYLEGYSYPLPESLASVGGWLDLRGYTHPLPESFTSVGGCLYLRSYAHPLPESLASVGGGIDLRDYSYPLPESLTSVGTWLDLRDYTHPLPEGFTSVGGWLDLEGYTHPLPEGFTSVGGDLYLKGYAHPLPEGLTSVGGWLGLRGYAHPLPEGLVKNRK